MCCTIGPSTCSRGSVTLRCRPSARIGRLEPDERRDVVRPRAGGVDERGARGSGRPTWSRRTGAAGVRVDLDAGHLGVGADHRACLGGPEREERRGEDRVGMALRGAVRGAEQVVGEVRSERRGAPRPRARASRARPPPRSRACRAGTAAPPPSRRPSGRRSCGCRAGRRARPRASSTPRPPRRGGAPRSAAGRARCRSPPAVSWWMAIWKWKLPAFVPDASRLSSPRSTSTTSTPSPREVVRERRAGEAAADDQRRPCSSGADARARARQPATPARVVPGRVSSTSEEPPSSIDRVGDRADRHRPHRQRAASATGRRRSRARGAGDHRGDLPLAVAALAEAHAGAREALDHVHVRRRGDRLVERRARVTSSQRQTTVSGVASS